MDFNRDSFFKIRTIIKALLKCLTFIFFSQNTKIDITLKQSNVIVIVNNTTTYPKLDSIVLGCYLVLLIGSIQLCTFVNSPSEAEDLSDSKNKEKFFLFNNLPNIFREINIVIDALTFCIIFQRQDLNEKEIKQERVNIQAIKNVLFEIQKVTIFEKLVHLVGPAHTCPYPRAYLPETLRSKNLCYKLEYRLDKRFKPKILQVVRRSKYRMYRSFKEIFVRYLAYVYGSYKCGLQFRNVNQLILNF